MKNKEISGNTPGGILDWILRHEKDISGLTCQVELNSILLLLLFVVQRLISLF